MLGKMLENVRYKSPLINNITNFVTVNDCANIILASGGSPIMADSYEEVAEIVSICAALNINIGTIHKSAIEAMLLAGTTANKLNIPIILDPVGLGASNLRNAAVKQLLATIKFAVIRGNASEIKALAFGSSNTKGVDVNAADQITAANLVETVNFTKKLAQNTNSIIIITGAIDIVANSQNAYCIHNGHPMMASITGTGCQLSALIATYIGANPDNLWKASAAAVVAMGIAGEIAHKRLSPQDGNATYRNYIIDAIYHMTPQILEREAKYELC